MENVDTLFRLCRKLEWMGEAPCFIATLGSYSLELNQHSGCFACLDIKDSHGDDVARYISRDYKEVETMYHNEQEKFNRRKEMLYKKRQSKFYKMLGDL